jgi:hypothetical protein
MVITRFLASAAHGQYDPPSKTGDELANADNLSLWSAQSGRQARTPVAAATETPALALGMITALLCATMRCAAVAVRNSMRALTAVVAAALILFAIHAQHTNAADESFESVFNGEDLGGWVVEGTQNYGKGQRDVPVWTAEDDRIVCNGHGFGFLRYDRSLTDFVLKLEYRLNRGVNSGVGIRYEKFTGERKTRPSYAGYEIQLLDDAGKKPNKSSTASLYRYVAASADASKPAGEWNALTIECRGPRIRVTLNGKMVQDVDQSTIPEIADKPLRGHISLQNHGGKVAFRRIRIQELK